MTTRTFARNSERDAYRLLHEKGYEAFRAEYGNWIAHDLTEHWINRKIARIKWIDGAFEIKTFKKYAEERDA